jgi:FAD/FMN-containing dehydrogenase
MYMTDVAATDAAVLQERLAGDLTVPGDPNWDAARRAWNLAVDQRPAAVAEPETVSDVQVIVDFARERGLFVAAQSTGHNAGPLAHNLARTILVKTHRMRSVEIDAPARLARVQAGAQWSDVAVPASAHGLAALAGSAPDVGVMGYTLGGGLSWLARKHGLAANRVRAIQVVTADGRVRIVGAHHEPDLFWALRGGGGNFGVVTGIELELEPVEGVYAGMLVWPWERAREVLQAWRAWADAAPEEVTSVGRILQVPPLPEIPEAVRGRQIVVVEAAFLGDADAGAELLAPLRALDPEIDTFATVPPAALLVLHMDPPEPVPGVGDGGLLDEVPAAGIDALVDAAGPGSGSALLSVELRHLGGAVGRDAPGHGAIGRLDGDFAIFAVGVAPDPAMAEPIRASIARVRDALAPWDRGRRYGNFAESRTEAAEMFPPRALRRLRAVKTLVDPDDLFRANHQIPAID